MAALPRSAPISHWQIGGIRLRFSASASKLVSLLTCSIPQIQDLNQNNKIIVLI